MRNITLYVVFKGLLGLNMRERPGETKSVAFCLEQRKLREGEVEGSERFTVGE